MGWRKPKQSSLLIPLSPASQCCFVQPFATCFSKYQPCWNDWEVHHCVQQSQELTSGALNPLLQMQIFCRDRNEEGSDPSSSFTTKPRCRARKLMTSVDRSACQEAHGFGLPASQPGSCCSCCCGQGPWVCKGSCYLPAASILTPDTVAPLWSARPQGPLLTLPTSYLLTSYTFLGRSKLVVHPSSQGWCNAVLPIMMRCPKPVCLGWNCGAWKSWSVLQQSQSCAARTLLH